MFEKRPRCALWCNDIHESDDPWDVRDKKRRRRWFELWEKDGSTPRPFRKPPGDPVCPRRDFKLSLWQKFEIRVLRIPPGIADD